MEEIYIAALIGAAVVIYVIALFIVLDMDDDGYDSY